MPADTRRLRAAFLAAAVAEDAAARAAILDRECGTDQELRQQVEALFRAPAASAHELGNEEATAPNPPVPPVEDSGAVSYVTSDEPTEHSVLQLLAPATTPGALGRLGHYEVQKVIGRGGFGIVLKAFDEKLHRVVAIKMLAPELAATSPARKRFLREARAAAAVRHENVVQIHAVEETPIPYLVMEYIPGVTLQHLLDRTGPLDGTEVVRIGMQVARGLAAAHDKGMVHRDIKPGNILLESGPEMRAKLTDFGLARAADDASLTQSGMVAGTPMYMAPEQARGEPVDERSDLFSLGSLLYVMLSGRPPFRAGNSIAVLNRVCDDTPRPIREIIPEAPPWLCDIISRLHAKDPAKRYQSARALADVLADCLQGRTDMARAKPSPAALAFRVLSLLLLLAVLVLGVTELTGVTTLLSARQPGGGPRPSDPAGIATTETFPQRFKNTLGMEFVLIPKGRAWLNGSAGKPGDKEVDISHDFYLGVYEVTQEEWERVLGNNRNPSRFSRSGKEQAAIANISDAEVKRFPVDSVSWDQCQEFVHLLNAMLKEQGWVYRLPKSVEWEYACRGGPMKNRDESGFDFYLQNPSNALPPDKANCKESGLMRPCKVGSYPPNPLQLHDMHGNVFELCDDVAMDGESSVRVLRGGAWLDEADLCVAGRTGLASPSHQNNGSGLRLARVRSKSGD